MVIYRLIIFETSSGRRKEVKSEHYFGFMQAADAAKEYVNNVELEWEMKPPSPSNMRYYKAHHENHDFIIELVSVLR